MPERKSRSRTLADEAQRVRELWRHAPPTFPEKIENVKAIWREELQRPPRPPRPPSDRRIGWVAVAIAVGVLLVISVVAVGRIVRDWGDTSGYDSEFWAYPAIIGLFLACAAACVVGIVVVVVAAVRLIRLTLGDAVRAMVIGFFGGPAVYFISFAIVADRLPVDGGLLPAFVGLMMCVLPVICGSGVTLAAAVYLSNHVVHHRSASEGGLW